jgi:hypothetical protein
MTDDRWQEVLILEEETNCYEKLSKIRRLEIGNAIG